MDDFWEKKIDKVVDVCREYGYKELNKEFWMNKPAVLTSLVLEIYNSKKEVIKKIEDRR